MYSKIVQLFGRDTQVGTSNVPDLRACMQLSAEMQTAASRRLRMTSDMAPYVCRANPDIVPVGLQRFTLA